ncbi:fa2c4c86-9f5d-403b-9ff8-6dbdedd70969 [Thermothielavioides terrestris]|uniref:Fa2c4c86-9f5d-403b-9ff8-6dbdedd70969 n=1 Tax=Thermothielavioides terrestris TaxID=2587410 RepID=A0A446BHG2_9PEZI|nr:fa2c4c86-9f5d-403b-9ff8-6dbdedd70969 [Thermothielavioides terrestris]
MSAPSASPSPLQVAANAPPDDAKMPKGHCRYILLQPGIKGQRCACVNFSLNKDIPSATCDCGHLACYHNTEPDSSTDQRMELELLKKRLHQLEEQLSKGQDDILDGIVSRLNEVEDHLEKSREEFGEQIKGVYRNVSMSWRSIEQVERRSQQQDDQIRQIYDKLRDHDEQLDRLHAGQLELRDADLSLEERIENLTETLEEEEEEWRLSVAAAAAAATGRPRRRSTSDTSRPNIPLGPLGAGAALLDALHSHPHRSPAGGPFTGTPSNRAPLPRPTRFPASAPSTGAWTVHISLLPHAFVPMPFERNTNAYQRCLSRGLHRMVAVQGRDAASFRAAVEKAFGQFLRGREWMPLQAKLCDAETLLGLPMLRPLDENLLRQVNGGFDHAFLRRHCAVLDANGVIDSLYIAMRRHTISWHTLRHSPVFMEGLEDCWKYDPLLDRDPYDGDMAVDDEDRPAAGDITTAVRPPLQAAGLKRPLTEMSRSNSFGSAGAGTPAGGCASSGISPAGTDAGADEARVKRSCPAPPPQGAIVGIRRRDPIKTV